MKKSSIFLWVLIILIAVPAVFLATNKGGPLWFKLWGTQNLELGIAAKRYDVVAYQSVGKAIPGDQAWVFRWNDADWHFSSEQNRAAFAHDPERFTPAYGGYCATAVSAGMTFDVDPGAFHVEDGRLFLFFNADARQDFIAGIGKGIIARADGKWQKNL